MREEEKEPAARVCKDWPLPTGDGSMFMGSSLMARVLEEN